MADELPVARWARWAPWVIAVAGVTGVPVIASTFEQVRDVLREGLDQSGTFTVSPQGRAFAVANVVGSLQIGAWVALLVWQHKAATAGRALGFPARRTPAMGVGAWFIPVVNFWFPYQALRDCLPPGHPGRPVVLRWWLGYLATFVTLPAVALAAVYGPTALAVVLTVGLAAFAAWVAWNGMRMIDAIATTHAAATRPVGDNPT